MKTIIEAVEKKQRPIKAVQFGEGNFLRAFIDYQIDVMNEKAGFNGDVMMVQPLERGMGDQRSEWSLYNCSQRYRGWQGS